MTSEAAVSLVVVVALLALALRLVRPRTASTLDFYLAGQRVGVLANACAICGDYLSAASFLGVAGAVYASGLDGVWYATGFAAGFVPVLLFVAAPLRRFGEFSIPDFLGRRLASEPVRLVSVVVVQLVIVAYLIPQAVGSGLTWELLIGRGVVGLSPYATGVLASALVITLVVSLGGMRGTTWTQALQFLLLLAVTVWLTVIVVGDGFRYPEAVATAGAQPLAAPVVGPDGWELAPVENLLDPDAPARFNEPGARYGRLGQFALVVTLALGTAGLPHVMHRYFTSASGTATRMTTVWVVGLGGVFYALAVLLGTAARVAVPQAVADRPWLADLTVDGVLRVPEHALLVLGRIHAGGTGLAVVATGALVAVFSTIAGLLLASAASWGHDVYERHLNPHATQRQALRAGRLAVVGVAVLATSAALLLEPRSLATTFPSLIATMVAWAFALAGSALTPPLVLAIWWRRTTAAGACAGMAVGTGIVIACGAAVLAVSPRVGADLAAVLVTPTLFAAPAAALATIGVSRLTRPPDDLERTWVRLHGISRDREAERLARLTIAGVRGRRESG